MARLVRDDVLEHVFEVLRDAGRARSAAEAPGRTAHALAETRGAADAAGRAALACLMDVLRAAAPDPEAARACSTRMVLGMDVLSATLARSAQTRDTETAIAATRLARAVAELGDPGNVPGTAAGRLADALLDAYDALPVSNDAGSARADRAFVEYEYVPPVTSGGGVEPVGGFRRQVPTGGLCRAEACAAVAAMLAWPSLADAAAGAAERGDRAETSARAARVFERLARDVTRNLRGFGAEEDARDGVSPRLGSPYAAPGGADEWGARGFAWDLPPGAADAMVSALCDHFEAEDAPAAERVLRECGMHEALAAAMLRLAVSCETAARRNAALPPRWDVERAVAAAIRAYGSLLASGPPESRADPFNEDPNESEATVDGAATVVIDQTDTDTARADTIGPRRGRTRRPRRRAPRGGRGCVPFRSR